MARLPTWHKSMNFDILVKYRLIGHFLSMRDALRLCCVCIRSDVGSGAE